MVPIPSHLQSILWSKDISTLDSTKDAPYIIHQTLSHGDLEALRWLKGVYSPDVIKSTFLTYPFKDYPKARFYFVKNMILEISDELNERLYVRNTPRDIRHQ